MKIKYLTNGVQAVLKVGTNEITLTGSCLDDVLREVSQITGIKY